MKFTLEDLKKSACGHLNPHILGEVKKKAKYRNTKTEIDGIKFDSRKEAKRYGELKLLLKAGKIGLLELQKEYLLIDKNEKERACKYLADFVYRDMETGEIVVEDVKSEATRKLSTYIMKRKLMKDKYGIEIKEV